MTARASTLAGVVVAVVALVVLVATLHRPNPPFPKADAAAATERSASVRAFLAQHPATRRTVIALDRRHWRVTYWNGSDELLDLDVGSDRRVKASEQHLPGVSAGATLLRRGPLVVLLALVFIAALATRPLVSLRNLDAVVAAAIFTATAALIDTRAVAPRVWLGALGLAYIAVRCGRLALAAHPDDGLPPVPLIRSNRLLALVAGAALLGGVVIVVTSTSASDVAFAGLAGGTLLNHGVSPYGHMPREIVHGDTYPPLTYVLYMPFAALAPVRNSFDSLGGALWLNALGLAIVTGLLWLSRGGARWALAWLAFPPVLLAASQGGNDVLAALFATAAVVSLSRTTASTALLAVAGWVKIGPGAALIPLLAHMRRANRVRSLAAIVAVSSAGVILLLALGAMHPAVDAIRFQLHRGSWFSPWQQLGAPGLQVVFQAISLGLIAAAAVTAAREPSMRRVAAAGAMTIALLQLCASYWTYAYLLWLLPFMLVALFPPAPQGSQRREQPAP